MLAVPVASVLAAPLCAQREQAQAKVDRLNSVIDYGVARFGKHAIDEVPVGSSWRLGQNLASTWTTEMPVLAGDALVAPGQYRVRLTRQEQGFSVEAEGAALALGGDAAPPLLPGELKSGKHLERLELEWQAAKGATGQKAPAGGTLQPYELHVRFGPHHLTVPLAFVGGHPVGKLPAHELVAFGCPAELLQRRLAAGLPTVVATLRAKSKAKKDEPELWNLVLAKDGARLVAGMRAPTASFGFGDVETPAAAWGREVTLQWESDAAGARVADANGDASARKSDTGGTSEADGAANTESPRAARRTGNGEDTFTVREVKSAKGLVELQFAFGGRRGTMSFELPVKPK